VSDAGPADGAGAARSGAAVHRGGRRVGAGRPPARFHARVAANVLAIVARELGDEEPTLVAEWTRLATLLGRPGDAPPDRLAALRTAVADMTEELCARIRRGDADAAPFREAVRAAVAASVAEKLAVANPRFLAP
jgi:hypothetical protein